MQGTKIYLAGAEVDTLARSLFDNGVKRILWSYFYIRQMRRETALTSYIVQNPQCSFFLDSGAFTYFTMWQKNASKLPPYEEYVKSYFSFIDEYGHLFDYIAEPDLDNTVPGITEDTVTWWREDMLTNWPELAHRITPTWHGWRGRAEWMAYCHDPRLKSLAIGRQSGTAGYHRLLTLAAKRNGKTVHGFAQTRVNTALKTVPFSSVDSSVGSESIVWVRDAEGSIHRTRIDDLYNSLEETESRGKESRALSSGLETLTVVGSPGEEYKQVWRPLRSVVRHITKKQRIYVRLKSGRSLEVTSDHSLFKMTPKGALVEVKPTDLKIGDWVVCPTGMRWKGKGISELLVPLTIPGRGNRWGPSNRPAQEVDHKFELTSEFLEMCGYWVGNGSYTGTTSIGFSCGLDQEPTDMVRRWADSLDRKATVSIKNDVQVSHNHAVRAFMELGFGRGSFNKRLPDWFWDLSEDQACSFMRGLFSSDGSGGRLPSYSTTSEELAGQVQDALWMLIGPGVSKRTTNQNKAGYEHTCDGYSVIITSHDEKVLFSKKIGFFIKRKQDSLELGEGRWSRITEIPTELGENPPLRRAYSEYNLGSLVLSKRVPRNPEWFSESVLSDDLLYVQVEGLTDLGRDEIDVYDLEVPETEKFVANGILAHNTSWLSGQQYGTTFIFHSNKFITLSTANRGKEKRKLYRKYFKAIGCDYRKVEGDDVAEVRKANVIAWRMLADRLEEIQKRKEQFGNEPTKDREKDTTRRVWAKERLGGRETPKARERTREASVDTGKFKERVREREPSSVGARER